MRLIHISDLHVLADPASPHNAKVQTRLDYIFQRYFLPSREDPNPDCRLIVSGDIIDNEGAVIPGTPAPIDMANLIALLPQASLVYATPGLQVLKTRKAMANALKMLANFRGKIYICPGNHDYAAWGNFYDRLYAEAFGAYLWAPLAQALCGTAPPRFNNSFLGGGGPCYFRAGAGAHIFALDSCIRGTKGLSFGRGEVGEPQRQRLETQLRALPEEDTKIVFLHHHPWHKDPIRIPPFSVPPLFTYPGSPSAETMALDDSASFLDTFTRTPIDYLLFGHKHGLLENISGIPGIRGRALAAECFFKSHNGFAIDLPGGGVSPISYGARATPVTELRIAPFSTFMYQGGYFLERDNDAWEEWQGGRKMYSFDEVDRSEDWITLYDRLRDVFVALPDADSGTAFFRGGSDADWTELYNVQRQVGEDPGNWYSPVSIPGGWGTAGGGQSVGSIWQSASGQSVGSGWQSGLLRGRS